MHDPAPRDDTLGEAWERAREELARTRSLSDLGGEALFRRFGDLYRELSARPRRARRRLQRRLRLSLAGVALLLALGGAPQVYAATIQVGGGCTLIDAIKAANTDTATGGCTPGSGPDTIVLPTGSVHTLTAVDNTYLYYGSPFGSNGLPFIASDITIDGNGSTIERAAGSPSFRIFFVGNGASLTLNQTTVSGGTESSGGGIFARNSVVTLNDSIVTGNNATHAGGGISAQITMALTLNRSVVSANQAPRGSAILGYYSRLTLNDSTISGNIGPGNAIDCTEDEFLTINRTTISGNEGTGVKAPLGFVNGIRLDGAVTTIRNSTISGNSGIGVYARGSCNNSCYVATVSIQDSTITGNGGPGILDTTPDGSFFNQPLDSRVTVHRSIVSGNGGVQLSEWQAAVFQGTHNVLGHDGLTTDQLLAGIYIDPSNLLATSDGTTPTPLASILDTALADNGGPTPTHALPVGSPALDAVPCVATEDQRGVVRPQGAGCDAGAFERSAAAAAVPSVGPPGLALGALMLGAAGIAALRREDEPPDPAPRKGRSLPDGR